MKVISIDAETNGLRGEAFAIAAVMYEDQIETGRFVGRCSDDAVTNDWVKENVIPHITEIPITYKEPINLLHSFIEWWKANKEDATVIAHMAIPVEANLFQRGYNAGYMGEFDGPYRFIDVAGTLDHARYDPTSVEDYASRFELPLPKGSPHNPVFDCELAALVYFDLKGLRKV